MSYIRTVSAMVTGLVVFNLALLGGAYLKWGRDPGVDKGSILRIDLGGGMTEYPPGGFTSGLLAPDAPTLHTVLDNLDKASVDK